MLDATVDKVRTGYNEEALQTLPYHIELTLVEARYSGQLDGVCRQGFSALPVGHDQQKVRPVLPGGQVRGVGHVVSHKERHVW
jgi:hypothetical protein